MVGASLNIHNFTLKPTTTTTTTTIKFLCSYGGKILPRYPDAKLRYHGGETRVLAVDRSVSFAELLVKLGELCGTSVSLRCQLPTEDLDALVSITSDEDLANLIEEYDRAVSPPSSLKIRAFLSLPKSTKKISPSSSTASSSTEAAAPPRSPTSSCSATIGSGSYYNSSLSTATNRYIRVGPKPVVFPLYYGKSAGKQPYYAHANPSRIYLIHNGNHWQ